MNGRWIANKEACEFYGVSGNTMRRWGDTGVVECKRAPSGRRCYFVSADGIFKKEVLQTKKNNYIYVRVSSSKQKPDLERQQAFLVDKYPDHIVIKDIGSGLNYKRRGLLKLLELCSQGTVAEVVVFSKDRMCRFGFELIEHLFSQNDAKIVVHEQIDKTPETEFSEDILAILQVFACRWNGKRKYKIDKNKEVQIEVKQSTDQIVQEVGRSVSLDI